MSAPRANEPLGRSRYWPIFALAQELDLPIGIHSGGYGGHAPTGGGWLSYYTEEHQSNAHSMAAQLTSLVLEGVPERFPKLKVVFIEGGFGYIPSTTWRMDQHFDASATRSRTSSGVLPNMSASTSGSRPSRSRSRITRNICAP